MSNKEDLRVSSFKEMMQHGVSVQDINQAMLRRGERDSFAIVAPDGEVFWLIMPHLQIYDRLGAPNSYTLIGETKVLRGQPIPFG